MASMVWTPKEIEVAVEDYFDMLVEYHSGLKLNKAEHNRALQKKLSGRNRSAIEFRHQNISAVLVEDGLDYLDGYVPLFNVTDSVRDCVRDVLSHRPEVLELVQKSVEAPVGSVEPANAELKLVSAPIVKDVKVSQMVERFPEFADYSAIEMRNRSLGLAGEIAVLKHEHQKLWDAGKKQLAERIEHASQTRGDGLGYDVLSFEESGQERLIEVKTTRRAQLTPFHVSRNEVAVSQERSTDYHIYRLFRFEYEPQFFVLKGSIDKSCKLEPTEYLARIA